MAFLSELQFSFHFSPSPFAVGTTISHGTGPHPVVSIGTCRYKRQNSSMVVEVVKIGALCNK